MIQTKKHRHFLFTSTLYTLLSLAPILSLGQQRFSDLVGSAPVKAVSSSKTLQVPYITWGGDMATFHGNGGLKTKSGSIFQKQGLDLNLVPGDDFTGQVRDYMSGKSPFLRGTFRMMGMASEVIGSDPRTKGVVILQMTWSAGDHMVSRGPIKTVADLKGKTVTLQQGGPHVGMLDDILKTANLTWDDITVKWAKDLTGTPNSPAEIFKKDNNVDACFAITPDMIGLCGGLGNEGTGAEGTVRGAKVLVSTAELSRSIADVYVCRKDFYDANKALITKFVAGYLKSTEVLELKSQFEATGSRPFEALLQTTQDIYGKDTIPVLEEAHGLISDSSFVGYPGNVVFFTEAGNLSGFEAFQKSALDLAVNRGYAKERMGLFPSGFNYQSGDFTNYLTKTDIKRGERFRAEAVRNEIEMLSSGDELDDRTILSFTISFEPNQNAFSAVQYGAEFQRVMETAERFGNAVVAIRGHADPTKTLLELVQAGIKKGVLKRSGSRGNYNYSLNGRPLSLDSTPDLIRLIGAGSFDGIKEFNPRETMQAALNLSRKRAEAVLESIIKYAETKGITMDRSQVQPTGVGIREPFIAKPTNMDEARQNMRVEFRVIRVPAEATVESDFDF
ncbi:ABC transporter substrate-binding protein [bacterium]|nr:ABC transporter substrate-binding protein [bacterium]